MLEKHIQKYWTGMLHNSILKREKQEKWHEKQLTNLQVIL
jgi:hypothetical protein